MNPQVTTRESTSQQPKVVVVIRPPEDLVDLTVAFCSGGPLAAQTRRIVEIFSLLWSRSSDQKFCAELANWVGFIEQNAELQTRFRAAWQKMLAELDWVSFFVEPGVPTQNALLPETTRRIFQRLLPSAREETDAARIFTAVFASPRAVQRFLGLSPEIFARLIAIFWDPRGFEVFPTVREGIQEALRLLASRVAGRGSFRASDNAVRREAWRNHRSIA